MNDPHPYVVHLDPRFPPLEAFDVAGLAAACTDRWYNQTLCRVDEAVVRLGVVQGEYHWHHHDEEDEFFYVVEGRLLVDVEGGRTFELAPGQAIVVPKKVEHRPRAPERTVILMVERAGVVPTGDRGSSGVGAPSVSRKLRPTREARHPRRGNEANGNKGEVRTR